MGDLCEVDLGRVVDQLVCGRPSYLAVDLCVVDLLALQETPLGLWIGDAW